MEYRSMAIFSTAGLAGKKITVQPSKFDDGNVLVTIIGRDGSEHGSIALPAHPANMLAGALEHEAVNAFAIELMTPAELSTITLAIRDEKFVTETAVAA
jgi:hypothetical protein